MTQLDLLAQEIGINERTLRRAVNDGSLRGNRPTPRKLELSLAEQSYVRHAWPLISAVRRALRTEHNVRFALLFGSTGRGTDTVMSDIDILVSMRDPSLDRIIDLGAKLAAVTGRRVDPVRLEDAEGQPHPEHCEIDLDRLEREFGRTPEGQRRTVIPLRTDPAGRLPKLKALADGTLDPGEESDPEANIRNGLPPRTSGQLPLRASLHNSRTSSNCTQAGRSATPSSPRRNRGHSQVNRRCAVRLDTKRRAASAGIAVARTAGCVRGSSSSARPVRRCGCGADEAALSGPSKSFAQA